MSCATTRDAAPAKMRSLAVRLTLWYGGILLAALAFALAAFYFAMTGAMRRHDDARLSRIAAKCALNLRNGGVPAVARGFSESATLIGTRDVFFILRDGDGRLAASSNLAAWGGFPTDWTDRAGHPSFEYRSGGDGHDRVRVACFDMDGGHRLTCGVSDDKDLQVTLQTQVWLVLILAVAAVAALLVGWLMSQRALAGMKAVERAASAISAGGALDVRVPVSGRGDEVDRLAQTFNAMLDRVRRTVAGMRETNDNIAHELRSPITRIRGSAEITLSGNSSLSDYQALAASSVEECDRLLGIINTMLNIAEVESGASTATPVRVDLAQITRDAVNLFAPVAEMRGIHLELAPSPPCPVMADTAQLQRCVANMLDNAIKYAPEHGAARIATDRTGAQVRLEIANPCPGLSPGEIPRLFDRFYRGQHARSHTGNGLGLALARAVARAYGGDMRVRTQGEWVTFSLELPAAG